MNVLVILMVFTLLPLSAVAVAGPGEGAMLYRQNCAVCHGVDGDGGVGIPLNLPDFLAVASDDYLRNTLRDGRPGRVMPAFANLSDAEVEAIIGYIRSWSGQDAPVYHDRSLHGDAQRGRRLYEKNCTACHGDRGQGGTGTGVTFSRPREAPVMAPALDNPGFQDSVSDAMLKATLLRGRKGTPMPSIAALGLQEKDADDLVAYLRTLKMESISADSKPLEPVILYESEYDLEQTLENLKQAVVGRNFRVIREQYLDQGLAAEGKEDKHRIILYFCNFAFLNDALAIDPRVGLFLPCRITLIETDHGVQVMSINPKNLSRLFNNSELDRYCEQMHDLYAEIMEDATL
ncbi:MAG TPA: c-type cytochrome [Gammaproteobacteria bacterium]|nr:c-type cytochrome [Gammaproteobacteria bacterium]